MPKALTLLLFTSFIPLSIFNAWIVLKKYEHKYKACLIQAVISTFLTTLVSILLVMFYSQTAIVRIAPGIIISCLISIYLYYDMVKYGKCFYDQSIWKFVFSFCIVLLPHYFSEFILQSSDKIMIARMCGHDEVALYSIAYTVGALINVLVSAINSTLIPFRYQRMNTKEYSIISTASSIILCFVSLVLLIIMLLSPEIVYFFGGSGYLDAQILVVPICLGSFFNFVFQFFSSIQEYYEYTKPICFVSVVCAVLNIALNYFFINLYGYVAAAYTTFVTYLCFSVFHYYFYNKACTKQLGLLRPYDIKSFLFISLFTIFSAIYSYAVLDYRIIRVVSLVIVIIVLLIFSKKVFKFYKINR